MNIRPAVAHAIQQDLDILVALPGVADVDTDKLEPMIERYVLDIQEKMEDAIEKNGEKLIHECDAAGLCTMLLEFGVNIPPDMLLKMCRTIIDLSKMNVHYHGEKNGKAVYYVSITLSPNQ